MKIYIIRHGETTYNVKDICNQDPKINVPLTEKGILQAETARDILMDIRYDAVYTSQFPRARQTAEIINIHGAQTIIDERINDILVGVQFEAKPVADVEIAREEGRLPDGESFQELKLRANAFLNDLLKTDFKVVLIVTHQDTSKALIGLLKDLSDEEMFNMSIDNCQIIEIHK